MSGFEIWYYVMLGGVTAVCVRLFLDWLDAR